VKAIDPCERRAVQVKFRTKQLQRCYESHTKATQKWGADVARRYVERISILYAAETVDDLHRIPVLRFHPLKGNRQGQYALSLTARARLIVTFTGKTNTTAWIEEVSKHYGD
jgi:proteic killer suppression protein